MEGDGFQDMMLSLRFVGFGSAVEKSGRWRVG